MPDECARNGWTGGTHYAGNNLWVNCGGPVASAGSEPTCTMDCTGRVCGPDRNNCGICAPCAGTCSADGSTCTVPENCANGVDDDGDSYVDEADAACPITLSAAPNPTDAGVLVSLTTRASDGGLSVGGASKNICLGGCAANGACAGAVRCTNLLSCTIGALATDTTYYACVGQNSASTLLRINPAANCFDFKYIDDSIPLAMKGGVSYPVSVTVKNNCSQAWQRSDISANPVRLGAHSGNRDVYPFGPLRVDLSTQTVAAGVETSFNFNLIAPATPGTYLLQYGVVREGLYWFPSTSPAWDNNPPDALTPARSITVTSCDADGDGCNASYGGQCTNGLDCNDARGDINGCRVEWACMDGIDNNCNNRLDYDGFTYGGAAGTNGDEACTVPLNAIAAPMNVPNGTNFTLNCTVPVRVRSVIGTIDRDGTCSWSGNWVTVAPGQEIAQFNCHAPTAGVYNVVCTVANPYTYPGVPASRTQAVNAVNCDIDNDGYNASNAGVCATNKPGGDGVPRPDCNDNVAAINPGMLETHASGLCTNTIDDDCDAFADFDGGVVSVRGDSGCNVSITAIDAPGPSCYGSAGSTPLNCTYDYRVDAAAVAFIEQGVNTVQCARTAWDGTKAVFTCPTSPPCGAGDVNLTCSINQTKTVNATPDRRGLVQLRAWNNACFLGVCTEVGTCTDKVDWNGTAIDRPTSISSPPGSLVPQPINVTVDGVAYNGLPNPFLVPQLKVGRHNLTVVADGYELHSERDVMFNQSPTYHNVTLQPKSCTPACTFGPICDYDCIGQNGCNLAGFTATEQADIPRYCQFAAPGTVREYNATHMISCCKGPFIPASEYRAPLTLTSCSPAIVPHKTLVNSNGKFLELTVVSYARCD